jgi:hypothetical protein
MFLSWRATTLGTSSKADRLDCCHASPNAFETWQSMASQPGSMAGVTTSYEMPLGMVISTKCWLGGRLPLPWTSFSSIAVE